MGFGMCRAVRSFDLWRLPERCSRSPASLWAQSKVEERQYPATADGRRLEVCCYPSHGSVWPQPVQTRPLVRILRPYMASLHSCGRPRLPSFKCVTFALFGGRHMRDMRVQQQGNVFSAPPEVGRAGAGPISPVLQLFIFVDPPAPLQFVSIDVARSRV